MNTIHDEKPPVYNNLRQLECVLNSKNESFPNKVESLIKVWKEVSEYRLTDHKKYTVQLMDWLKLHTLNIVLMGDWKKHKDTFEGRLLEAVKECEMFLFHSNNIFSMRCRKLAEIIKDPWGNPILNRLLNSSSVNIGPEEIDFFCMETGYLISTRLRKLCESHCEDLALNLVTTFMRCHQLAESQKFSLNVTEDQRRFILDVYIALLYKYKKTSLIISTLKSLSPEEGLHLLTRFVNKRVTISKVWRHSNRIAHLAAQVYITATMLNHDDTKVPILEELLNSWLLLNNTTEDLGSLASAIRRIIQTADSAIYLYVFCKAVHRKFGNQMKILTIELYIRALTTDMNDLERQKTDEEHEKVLETTQRLADGFLDLADVLQDHVKVSRECVLTSFSLQPTQKTLDKIIALARDSDYLVLDTGQDWKCKLHPPVVDSDEISWECDVCGEFMSPPQIKAPLNTNMALSEALSAEQLGISSQLCDDLVVVLSSPRYQLFTWLLEWKDLHRLCVMYLHFPERTKNMVTELKFLDIDYSQFMSMKREPMDEDTGIERGYERYLEEDLYSDDRVGSSSEEILSQDNRNSEKMEIIEEPTMMLSPPLFQTRSDPDTLRSLRMFRPKLKGNKTTKPVSTEAIATVTKQYIDTIQACDTYFATPTSIYQPSPFLNEPRPHFSGAINSAISLTPRHSNVQQAVQPTIMHTSQASCNDQNVTVDSPTNAFEISSKFSGSSKTYSTFLEKALKDPNTSQKIKANEKACITVINIDSCPSKKFKTNSNSGNNNPSLYTSQSHTKPSPVSRSHLETNMREHINIKLIKDPTSKQYVKKLPIQETVYPYKIPISLQIEPIQNKISVCKDSSQQARNTITVSQNSTVQKFKLAQVPISPAPSKNSISDTVQDDSENVNADILTPKSNEHRDNFLLNGGSPDRVSGSKILHVTADTISDMINLKLHEASDQRPKTPNGSSLCSRAELTKENLLVIRKPCLGHDSTSQYLKRAADNEMIKCGLKRLHSDMKRYKTKRKNENEDGNMIKIEKIKKDSFAENSAKAARIVISDCEFENFYSKNLVVPPGIAISKRNFLNSKRSSRLLKANSTVNLNNVDKNKCLKTSQRLPKGIVIPQNVIIDKEVIIKLEYLNMEKKLEKVHISKRRGRPPKHLSAKYKPPKSSEECINLANTIEKLDLYNQITPYIDTSSSSEFLRSKNNPQNVSNVDNSQENETDPVQIHENVSNTMDDLLKKYNISPVKVMLTRTEVAKYLKNYPSRKFSRIKKPKFRKSENKRSQTKNIRRSKRNKKPKSWPLQDINPKVDRKEEMCSMKKSTLAYVCDQFMNPRVVLNRLDVENRRSSTSILNNVPGLNDLQMIRPSSVDRIVQVVQLPNSRGATSVPLQNATQTSTQVTPHIQRIGQPRTSEKPERVVTSDVVTTTATSTNSTTSTTETSTLVNILTQQVIRPTNQSTKPRSSQLVNILSNQTIRSGQPSTTTTVTSTKITPGTTSETQVNSIPRVISGGDQIISQIINPIRAPVPALKTLVSTPTSDQNRIVQFICKSSDGKLIPVTSFASNKVVKVSMAPTLNSVGTTDENTLKVTTVKQDSTSENSDALPKFQQAFGKSAYQNAVESPDLTTGTDTVGVVAASADLEKPISANVVKIQAPKNSSASLNVQPVQGGVIYTRQMPVAQTINLLPPGRGQVFRIATTNPEQLSLVKDTVIHGKMSALLAAALQGKQRTSGEVSEGDNNGGESNNSQTKVALTTRPMLVQGARIVKPVLQIPTNVIRSTPQSNLSSTTLEQLREFDMVYKQVKERSSGSAPTESSPQSEANEPTQQQISVTYLNQGQKLNCAPVVVVSSYCNVQPAASPSLSVTSQGSSSPCITPAPTLSLTKVATKSPKPKSIKNTTTHTSKASPIPKPQQKPQEDEHTTQRIFDILAEYAEQLRNSPDLNNKPAPRRRSNPPTNPNQSAKRKKSSGAKKTTATTTTTSTTTTTMTSHCSSSLTSDGDMDDSHTVGSEDSSCGVVQISVQEDDQTMTASSCVETNEASASPKPLIVSCSEASSGTSSQSRSLVITDSNVGGALKVSNTAVLVPGNYIMPVSMVKGGQQIAVVSGGSKILATVPTRSGPNMLLFQSFLNQPATTAAAAAAVAAAKKPNVPTLKYSTVQPVSGIRNVSNAATAAQIPTSVPTSSNQSLAGSTVALNSQSVTLHKLNSSNATTVAPAALNQTYESELLLTIAPSTENKSVIMEDFRSNKEPKKEVVEMDQVTMEDDLDYQNKPMLNTSVATSVIAQSITIKEETESDEHSEKEQTVMALNLNSTENDKDATIKVQGRVQSVLVTSTGTSNGPMLSHSPPFDKQSHATTATTANSLSESNKDEYLHNDVKRSAAEIKTSVYSYQGKNKKTSTGSQRLDRDLIHLSLQRKQAALERELHLQKSLSEECEDLGVDEPSTSDLFPEAVLFLESNNSPSFDQSSQDKRQTTCPEIKEEPKPIGLFCDDDSIKNDFLFEPIEYQNTNVEIGAFEHRNQTETNNLCEEDTTLLRTCTSMSDVTIPSPISPDTFADCSPPHFNKCKYKYSNRKKMERIKQPDNWSTSSSEDTGSGPELRKSCSRSPEEFSAKISQSCDEVYSFRLVEHLTPIKDGEGCDKPRCKEAVNCPSGRGARRSVKKTCSCCNGNAKVSLKALTGTQLTPPSTHKKIFIAKRR